MKLILIVLASAVFCANLHAEVRKCTAPNGKVTYSDAPCVQGSAVNPVTNPSGNTLGPPSSGQHINKDTDKTTANAGRSRDETAEVQSKLLTQYTTGNEGRQPVLPTTTIDGPKRVANCIRDVERQPASQNLKGELIAACRTAGQIQRSTELSEETVKNCVVNIERTAATGDVKARQIAICHGGDVKPEVTLPLSSLRKPS